MKRIETRKTIALMMTVAFVVFAGVEVWKTGKMPGEFLSLAVGCISFYFGKSTALETPKNVKDGE